MKSIWTACFSAVALLALASCSSKEETTNLLLQEWTGPYGGVPAFDKVEVSQFKPALEAGIAQTLADVDAIASNPEPANFENTIAAMERAGKSLDRAAAVYGVWSSTMSTDEFRQVESEMEPKLAAMQDKINQNAALFARIKAVYESPERDQLTRVLAPQYGCGKRQGRLHGFGR